MRTALTFLAGCFAAAAAISAIFTFVVCTTMGKLIEQELD